jgi:hypothetical protein
LFVLLLLAIVLFVLLLLAIILFVLLLAICLMMFNATAKKSLKVLKRVIRIRISKKNRQHSGRKKKVQKDKQRSTKHTYKNKDRVTRTPLKSGMNPGASEG